MKRPLLLSLLLLSLAAPRSAALADAVRPGAAASLALSSTAPFPLLRGNPGRTGLVKSFPASIKQLWKIHIKEGLSLPAVAAADAIVVAAASGHLVELAPGSGKELQRVALPAPAIRGLLVTSRGDRVVLTAAGECVGYRASGELRFRRPLPAAPRDLQAAPLPLPGGGLLVAAGAALLRLDGEGRVQDRVELPEAAAEALLLAPRGFFAVSRGGKVYRWSPPEAPRLLGSLGGALSATPLAGPRGPIAVVDEQRLVFFDAATGQPGVTVATTASLPGPLALGASDEVWASTSTGTLLAIHPEGRELERVPALAIPPDPPGPRDTLLTAEGGRVALLRATGELVLWSREGEITSEQRVCGTPLGLLSDGAHLVVSCGDGTVAAFGAGE